MMQVYILITLLVVLPSQLDAACPGGWKSFQNNCYRKFDPPRTWDDALTACVGQKAELVQVENEEENTFIKDGFGGDAWIGISRCHKSDTCRLDFSPATYTNWAPGQPDRQPLNPLTLQNKDFAVFVQGGGKWVDNPKHERRHYICKQPEDLCKDHFCNVDQSTCKEGKCICNPGWAGDYCYEGPCDAFPCENEGTCDVVGVEYKCTCVNFYYGKNCEVPPPCETKKPCKNGVCSNLDNGEYECKCNPGWTGKNCEVGPCHAKPCKNGVCSILGGGYQCKCNPGWTGKNCDVGPCHPKPCKNGGMCKVVGADYSCTCIKHYVGKNCEVPPVCQTKKPCGKNGACMSISNVDYKCICNTGWIGKHCDERPCDKKPCNAYQQCVNSGNTFKCVCEKGWSGAKCEKDGSACGDPHYRTFDGKRYDFMGKCEYIFAKDCGKDHSFEVLQQNEGCGWRSRVSCTKSVRVFFKTFEIIMQRSKVVYVNGVRVKLPWKSSGATLTSYRNGAILSDADLLFSVIWDGYSCLSVKINQRYKDTMCGLLGNADGNSNNDYQLPDKSVTTDVAKFGNSWKKNPKCINGVLPGEPCKALTTAQLNNVKQKCNLMKRPPFQQCNSKVTPDVAYIPNCVYDSCAMIAASPSAGWCQALATYERACKAKGVNVDWVGKPGFQECGNPCAKLPCFNGAQCTNINAKEYKCTCPGAFTGPKCQDVLCKRGYLAWGNNCYRRMTKRPWEIARCRGGDKFVSPENVDENNFIYQKFVQPLRQPFWMNVRICLANKFCTNDFGASYFHNFGNSIPRLGLCAIMPFGSGGKWSGRNCRIPAFFVCKHEIF